MHDEHRAPFLQQRFVECDTTLAPYSVGQVNGSTTVDDYRTVLTVGTPDANCATRGIVLVGPSSKIATDSYPAWALYETGDGTPSAGETWGAKSGSSKLNKGEAGFIICGDPRDGMVRVLRSESKQWYIGVVTGADIDAGADGTAEQCIDDPADWTPNGTSFTVHNPHGVILKVGLHVRFTTYPGWTGWIVEPWDFDTC